MDPTSHTHAGSGTGGTVPYANLTGKPTTMAPADHVLDTTGAGSVHTGTLAWSVLTGKPAVWAPADHAANHRTGGSDVLNAAQVGGWLRVAAGDTLGTKIFCGTGAPAAPAEGDVWIIG
jgi:sugar/nucleoside kinase (ribokinase family)